MSDLIHWPTLTTLNIAILKYLNEPNPHNSLKANRIKKAWLPRMDGINRQRNGN